MAVICGMLKKRETFKVFIYGAAHTFTHRIVHPKMNTLSSFTHPQVVPNLYDFELLQIWNLYEVRNCLVTNILQNIFFCVHQKFVTINDDKM